jgi:hypothetical protein
MTKQYKKSIKKHRVLKRRTQRKRGGNTVNNFVARRSTLIDTIRLIVLRNLMIIQNDPTINEEIFVNEIRAFESEADAIDGHFRNHNMEDMLNNAINVLLHAMNERQNNNSTITNNSYDEYGNIENDRNN